MLFWALLASGKITMRKVEGWHKLTQKIADKQIDCCEVHMERNK